MSRITLFHSICALTLLTGGGGDMAWAQPLEIGDPLAVAQVVQKSGKVRLFLDSEVPEGGSRIPCSIPANTRGTVVARRGDLRLVVYNSEAWAAACGKSAGVGKQHMAWVRESDIRSVQDLNREGYGDVCSAYTYLEGNASPPPTPETPRIIIDEVMCRPEPLASLFGVTQKKWIDLNKDPCLREGGPPRSGPLCSFAALYAEATTCGKAKSGAKVPCGKAECERRLGRLACQNSPWKGKSLNDRFNAMMALSHYYGTRHGIEPRALPCIAGVETGYLEPMAKNLMSCSNPQNHSYHGLGMITLTTLEHYLSPYIGNTVTGLDKVQRQTGPFRTVIPEFNKPSFYACPQKMHDALGSSPELQIELMAYTVANKLSAVGGRASDPKSEYNAYMNYNGHLAVDPQNGQPHAKNYADAVMACVKCLRARLPDLTGESALPAGDPVHCLSATTHSASGHRFWLKPGQRIESVFNGSIKRYCGEGGA